MHLTVLMHVTVSVRCTMDLKRKKGLLIHIKKKKAESNCILKLNSLAQETATIISDMVSYVSFIDCHEDDLLITIDKTIGTVRALNNIIVDNQYHLQMLHFT